jgi:hypothetical protein
LDVLVGVVAERTTTVDSESPSLLVKGVEAFLFTGQITREREYQGLDLVDFEFEQDADFPPPASYGGVSGGALWRAFVVADGGKGKVRDRAIIGVAYYQSDGKRAPRFVTCHGPRSVYMRLLDQIEARWPDEAL